MNKVYIVFEPATDPYGGGGWIKKIFLNEKEAEEFVENYNKNQKYKYDYYYFEEYEIGKEYL